MKKVVISQSMFFPWVGLLEQIRLADVYVYYDDVQFSKGSFVNRVQLKTAGGRSWLTVPLSEHRLGQTIQDVAIAPVESFRERHLRQLRGAFQDAPFAEEAIQLVESLYRQNHTTIGSLARESLMSIVRYFGLDQTTQFVDVVDLGVPGSSSQRVYEIVSELQGTVYITGHGASRYLDHFLFDADGIEIDYMEYECRDYPQLHGEFTPYVSSLDLIANCGPAGSEFICSGVTGWKEFVRGQA